jgi:hypothetical protein
MFPSIRHTHCPWLYTIPAILCFVLCTFILERASLIARSIVMNIQFMILMNVMNLKILIQRDP